MINTDPEALKKTGELADRNIAKGDWGDEVTPPGGDMPLSPEEYEAEQILSKSGDRRLPKRKM